jgi:hypothetical protein
MFNDGEGAEAMAGPGDNSVRLDDDERVPPAWPQPGYAGPEEAVGKWQMMSSRSAVVQYRQLLAEGEDFELECGPAPERCGQGMKQRNDDRAHVRHATTNSGKTSMISRRMEIFARTI